MPIDHLVLASMWTVDGTAEPRSKAQPLVGYLRAATDAGADAVPLTSFNEWPETTVVETSSSWSDLYLYLRMPAEWKGIALTAPPLPERPK